MDGAARAGDVLAAFRQANGIPEDEATRASWTCRIGPFTLRLPNFHWRKKAILAHDLHHVLTGYPCTMRGECQVAAWEFGAGAMPHWGARMFCLPLVLLGVLWSPRRIWRAFASGRQAKSLHSVDVAPHLAGSMSELRMTVYQSRRPVAGRPLLAVFLSALVIEATLIVSVPLAVLAGLCFAAGIWPAT